MSEKEQIEQEIEIYVDKIITMSVNNPCKK